MQEDTKHEAEKTLRHLCLGLEIVGVRWSGNFHIVIEPTKNSDLGRPDLLLRVESRLAVYRERPIAFPDQAEDLPDLSLAERAAALAPLARQKIVAAELGEQYAHLILTFESGAILFVAGYDPLYESWTLQSYPHSYWMLQALPGGDIHVGVPKKDYDIADEASVWVFNGNHNHFPSAAFTSQQRAEEWIGAHKLEGTLTRYPLDVSVYDWVIARELWHPKRDDQRTPEFIANFSSAHTGHEHYDEDVYIDEEDG